MFNLSLREKAMACAIVVLFAALLGGFWAGFAAAAIAVVTALTTEIILMRRSMASATAAPTPATVPSVSRWKNAWEWCYDKLVVTPLAYGFIGGYGFCYGLWLGACWCGRKVMATARIFGAVCGWVWRKILRPLAVKCKVWRGGTKSAALTVFAGIALTAAVWGAVHWLHTFRFMYALQLPVVGPWDWVYGIGGRLFLVAGIVILFRMAYWEAGINEYWSVAFCGRRWRVAGGEGYHLMIPVLEKALVRVEKITEPVPIENTTVQTKDDEDPKRTVETILRDMSVIFSQDVVDLFTMNKWIMVKDKAWVLREIKNTATQELNILAGNTRFTDFRENLEAIVLIINCKLRLAEMPHIAPWRILGGFIDAARINELPEGKVEVKDRICFYNKWSEAIQRMMKASKEKSELEIRLGVVIEEFKIGDTDFSGPVKQAMEERTKAAAKVAGDRERRDFIEKTAEKIAAGKVPIQAYQAAMAMAGIIPPGDYKVAVNSYPDGPQVSVDLGLGKKE